jgi:hypothetical protein
MCARQALIPDAVAEGTWDLHSWRLAVRMAADCDPWERPIIVVVRQHPIPGSGPTWVAPDPGRRGKGARIVVSVDWRPDYTQMPAVRRRYLLTYRVR